MIMQGFTPHPSGGKAWDLSTLLTASFVSMITAGKDSLLPK